MDRTHNCLSDIRKELMEADDTIQYVRFNLSNISDMTKRNGIKKTGQAIEVGVKKVRRNGVEYVKEEKSFVSHTYCPFCGKAYEPTEKETDYVQLATNHAAEPFQPNL